jgi:hypothetical protein
MSYKATYPPWAAVASGFSEAALFGSAEPACNDAMLTTFHYICSR